MGESAVDAANRSWWKVAPLFFALVPLVAIPLVFALTYVRSWYDIEPGTLALVAADPVVIPFFLMALTPLAALVGWREFTRTMSAMARGLLAGLIFGLWSLSCAIMIPYLGLYPAVWAAAIHGVIFGWGSHGDSFWATLYVVNLVVCPLAGMFLFQRMARWRQKLEMPV